MIKNSLLIKHFILTKWSNSGANFCDFNSFACLLENRVSWSAEVPYNQQIREPNQEPIGHFKLSKNTENKDRNQKSKRSKIWKTYKMMSHPEETAWHFLGFVCRSLYCSFYDKIERGVQCSTELEAERVGKCFQVPLASSSWEKKTYLVIEFQLSTCYNLYLGNPQICCIRIGLIQILLPTPWTGSVPIFYNFFWRQCSFGGRHPNILTKNNHYWPTYG